MGHKQRGRDLEHATKGNVNTQRSCLGYEQHTDTLSLLASYVFATELQQMFEGMKKHQIHKLTLSELMSLIYQAGYKQICWHVIR